MNAVRNLFFILYLPLPLLYSQQIKSPEVNFIHRATQKLPRNGNAVRSFSG